MSDSRSPALPHLNSSSSRMRIIAAGLAVMVAVAFSVVLGPVTAANAETVTVNNMTELFHAFSYAADGDIIELGADITGGAVSRLPLIVPATLALTLDLASFDLILEGASSDAGLGGPAGTELTITGGTTGTLTATGGDSGVGIGGGEHANGAAVSIGADAIVTASSSDSAYTPIGAGDGGSDFGSLTNAGSLTKETPPRARTRYPLA